MAEPSEELRLKCLEAAAKVGGTSDAVLKIARKYLDFVTGPVVAADLSDEPETIKVEG